MSTGELGIDALTADIGLSQGDIFSQMILGSVVHTSTVLLRRERLEKVRGFREDLKVSGEDYDFHLRTCREGPVAFADIPTIGYTVGRADQLTAPSKIIHVAQNALLTIEPILAESRHLIRLPSRSLERMLAGRHAWVARELLDAGRRKEALIHARKSISYAPTELRRYVLWGVCALPPSCLSLFRSLRRGARSLLLRATTTR